MVKSLTFFLSLLITLGVEKVVGLPGKNTVFLVLDANTGADVVYSGDKFVDDGTANDIEVI